jgi:hypothetical protein
MGVISPARNGRALTLGIIGPAFTDREALYNGV